MPSVATHNSKEWGCTYKNTHISATTRPRILNWVPNYFLVVEIFPDCPICKLSNLYIHEYL